MNKHVMWRWGWVYGWLRGLGSWRWLESSPVATTGLDLTRQSPSVWTGHWSGLGGAAKRKRRRSRKRRKRKKKRRQLGGCGFPRGLSGEKIFRQRPGTVCQNMLRTASWLPGQIIVNKIDGSPGRTSNPCGVRGPGWGAKSRHHGPESWKVPA